MQLSQFIIMLHGVKGGGVPNLLQYYNRGGGVYWDPKFVLRNKWTSPYCYGYFIDFISH